MRQTTRGIRVASALAVIVCVMAATAAASLAVTIEPLNTKFESTSESGVELKVGGVIWACERAAVAGTTESTKVNYVKVTPSIPGCASTFGSVRHTLTYANSCKEKGTVPWTLALTEGTGPFKGTVKLNCAATLTVDEGGACVVKVSEQTIAKELEWTTLRATEPFESLLALRLGAIKYVGTGPSKGALCGFFGFKGEAGGENLSLKMRYPKIPGIKAV